MMLNPVCPRPPDLLRNFNLITNDPLVILLYFSFHGFFSTLLTDSKTLERIPLQPPMDYSDEVLHHENGRASTDEHQRKWQRPKLYLAIDCSTFSYLPSRWTFERPGNVNRRVLFTATVNLCESLQAVFSSFVISTSNGRSPPTCSKISLLFSHCGKILMLQFY